MSFSLHLHQEIENSFLSDHFRNYHIPKIYFTGDWKRFPNERVNKYFIQNELQLVAIARADSSQFCSPWKKKDLVIPNFLKYRSFLYSPLTPTRVRRCPTPSVSSRSWRMMMTSTAALSRLSSSSPVVMTSTFTVSMTRASWWSSWIRRRSSSAWRSGTWSLLISLKNYKILFQGNIELTLNMG